MIRSFVFHKSHINAIKTNNIIKSEIKEVAAKRISKDHLGKATSSMSFITCPNSKQKIYIYPRNWKNMRKQK